MFGIQTLSLYIDKTDQYFDKMKQGHLNAINVFRISRISRD